MDEVIDITEAQIKRLKNLRGNVNKSDDELRQMLANRKVKEKPSAPKIDNYDIRFNEKMTILQTEFAVDTNNSNDAEALKSLVRLQIQLENVNDDIAAIQKKEVRNSVDYKSLKDLGDFQKTLETSVSNIQDKLGISRKIRKEKANDDVPQWIDSVLEKATKFFEAKTVVVECPKDQIELARYWINFPDEPNDISLELTCWKCKEPVIHMG